MKFRFITLLCIFSLCSNVYAEGNSEEQSQLLKVNGKAIKDTKPYTWDQKHAEETEINAEGCSESDHSNNEENCHKLEKPSRYNIKGQLASEIGEHPAEEVKPMESVEEKNSIKNDHPNDIVKTPTGDIPSGNAPINQPQSQGDHEIGNIPPINHQQDQLDGAINNIPPVNQQHNPKDTENNDSNSVTPVNIKQKPNNADDDDIKSIAPVHLDDSKDSLPIGTTTTEDSENVMFLNSNENNQIEEGNRGKIVAGVALTGAVLSVGAVLDFVKKNNPDIYSDIKRNISKRSNSIKTKAVTVTRKLTRKSSHSKTTSIENKNHYRHDLAEALIV